MFVIRCPKYPENISVDTIFLDKAKLEVRIHKALLVWCPQIGILQPKSHKVAPNVYDCNMLHRQL